MDYNEVTDEQIKLAAALEVVARHANSESKAKGLAKAFIVDAHRTNKQSMARLINALLEEYENDSFDARNGASVIFAECLSESRKNFNKRNGFPYI